MRKWQLGIALLMSAIALAVGSPHTVEAKLAPGIQDNTAGNVDKITNMRNTPSGAPYASDEGIMAKTAFGTGKSISNGKPGQNDNVGSPVDIQIGNMDPVSAGSTGNWFVMNYIDAPNTPNFMYFNNQTDATNFTPKNNDYGNITNKMTTNTSSRTLKPGSNYDGGYLNVSGNVPVHVVIQNTGYAVDSLLQGNWGVMVKVTLPDDLDIKSIANAIMWDKSYFYLDIGLAAIPGLSSIKVNFPLQFDHHVYEDPDDPKSFFLKVKGIPYNLSTEVYGAKVPIIGFLASSKKAYFIPRLPVDVPDLNNNKTINGQTTANVSDLTSVTAGGTTFQGNVNQQGGTSSLWGLPFILFSAGPVASLNNFGMAATLFNALSQSGRRTDVGAVSGIISGLSSILTGNGFDGNARINFNIDMSKYNGGIDSRYRPLTKGRLFPSPRADGQFNPKPDDPTNVSNNVFMTMYPSSSMVDPRQAAPNFAAVAQQDRAANADSPGGDLGPNANLAALAKVPGTTPVDFAVLNKSLAETPQTTYGNYKSAVPFKVVTNLTSWNSFIVPYDNRQDTTTNPVTYYKTILPNTPPIPIEGNSQVGSTILNRTAQPDFYQDGVFVNTGTAYKGVSDDAYLGTSDTEINAALNTVPNLAKGLTGAVTPKRYTRAYSYFNFNPNDSTSVGTKVDPQEITSNANVTFQATDKDATTGPTSIVNPSSVTGNASASGGNVTSLLGNPTKDAWQLTGKYAAKDPTTGAVTNIPMLSAPLKLSQQIQAKTGNDDDKTLAIKRSDIADGKTFTKTYDSAWSDPFVTDNTPDDIVLSTTKNGTTTKETIGEITSRQAELAPIMFIFKTGTDKSTVSRDATTNTLTVTISIGSADTYNQYDLAFVPHKLQIATTDGTSGYWNAQLADANAGHFLLNVLIADDIQKTVAVTNYFYNSSADLSTNPLTDAFTQQFVGAGQTATKVNVKGIFHSNSNVVLNDVDLLIPQPAGITLPSTLQVNNKDGSATGKTFTQVADNPTLVSGYVHYRYSGANLPALPSGEDQSKGAEIYYSYTMTVDATKLAGDTTPLTTEAISTANNKLTYMGEANTISLVKSTGVQLLSTPNLNFGKTWNADGTPQPYPLTGESTANDVQFTTKPNTPVDFLFQYLDGNTTQTPNDSWSLTASLSNFVNQNDSSAVPQSGFKIDYGRGEPTQTNGTIIMADSYLTNDGRVNTGILSGDTGAYAGKTVGMEHTANTMTSDNSSSVLYMSNDLYENRYLQPGTSQFKIRYDMTDTVNGVTTPNPAVKLTVPKAAFQTIKSGTYVSTASYTVNNALQ
ncbi:hypothetical protein [Lacticaseibacillus saniviri]|nr:hypothetical protein [Lacticaseibacillus saniviri]